MFCYLESILAECCASCVVCWGMGVLHPLSSVAVRSLLGKECEQMQERLNKAEHVYRRKELLRKEK